MLFKERIEVCYEVVKRERGIVMELLMGKYIKIGFFRYIKVKIKFFKVWSDLGKMNF